jgi:hypothetical protein
MAISELLANIWANLRGSGSGTDYVTVYDALGAVLWGLILFKVFLQEGLQVASGAETSLPRIFVKYLFVAAMFAVWPRAATALFDAVIKLAELFYPDLNKLLLDMNTHMRGMSESEAAAGNTQGFLESILGTIYNFTIGNLLVLIGMLILFLCYALVLVNIAGSVTVLALNLLLGPVFFALAFDRDFRSHSLHWFAAVLSYFMLIPLYGAALAVAATLLGSSLPGDLFGLPSSAQVLAQLIGPIMSVGVIFSTNKLINALVGGAAGSGAGSMALGLTGVLVSFIPGRALVRSTASAGTAVVGATAGAVKTVASKLSATARSALGK